MRKSYRFRIEQDDKICFQGCGIRFFQFVSLATMNSSLGIGGALAVQFAMISIGKFSTSNTVENIMLMLTTSVIAGFSGRRFLSVLSTKLEDQIGEANRNSKEAITEASMAKEDAEESVAIARGLATAQVDVSNAQRKEALINLKKYIEKKPTDRVLTLVAGRLCKLTNNLQGGIDILDRFVFEKGLKDEKDKDLADALFNRACYKTLLAEQQKGKKELVDSALDDLATSIEISSENAEDAKNDLDFKSLRDHIRFIELTKAL